MNPNSSQKGSEWNKWDLHVHTPASFFQEYGGDDEATWNTFIDKLEALPSDIKVLGINDYFLLEGHKKVLKYKSDGRLTNINLILPCVELRLNQFSGTESELKDINLHVIFNPANLSPEQIEQNFINGLVSTITVDGGTTWQRVLSKQAIIDLGNKIKSDRPLDSQAQAVSAL